MSDDQVPRVITADELEAQVAERYRPPLECLEGPEGCRGAVEYRMALSASGRPFPRCDAHWARRLELEDELNARYPTNPPSDWSPLDAGESWGEEDY